MVARRPDKGWGATRILAIAMSAVATLSQLHAAAQEVGADDDDESAVETATEAAEAQPSTITAPGGVPLEAAPSDTAVDSVKASMARIAQQAAAGVPKNYSLEFGDTFDWIRVDSGEWLDHCRVREARQTSQPARAQVARRFLVALRRNFTSTSVSHSLGASVPLY